MNLQRVTCIIIYEIFSILPGNSIYKSLLSLPVSFQSRNKKVSAKQNAINTATQNIQNSSDKTESDIAEKRKLPVTLLLGDSMVKDIKSWKIVLTKSWCKNQPHEILHHSNSQAKSPSYSTYRNKRFKEYRHT